MRPVTIGISSYSKKVATNFATSQNITYVPTDYITLLKDDNVIPFLLSPHIPLNHLDEVCTKIDGLFLTGGEDVDPSLYNESWQVQYIENLSSIGSPFQRPFLLKPNPMRDKFEIALYLSAKKKGIPIFGNCRGMQIINVAEGGSLFQEIPEPSLEHLIGGDGWIHYHEVCIEPTSTWGRLLQKSSYTTSSCHHQSIKQVAPSLRSVGQSSDGIIEMLEHQESDRFILGMQGHIEKMTINFGQYQNVMNEFITAAHRKHEKLYGCQGKT
jgi:putative glutamine amidotransferase